MRELRRHDHRRNRQHNRRQSCWATGLKVGKSKMCARWWESKKKSKRKVSKIPAKIGKDKKGMRNGALQPLQQQTPLAMAPTTTTTQHLRGEISGGYVGYPQSRHSWGQFPVVQQRPTNNGALSQHQGTRPLSQPPPPPPSRRELQRMKPGQQLHGRNAIIPQQPSSRSATPSVSLTLLLISERRRSFGLSDPTTKRGVPRDRVSILMI